MSLHFPIEKFLSSFLSKFSTKGETFLRQKTLRLTMTLAKSMKNYGETALQLPWKKPEPDRITYFIRMLYLMRSNGECPFGRFL